jgi:hypothetical protein
MNPMLSLLLLAALPLTAQKAPGKAKPAPPKATYTPDPKLWKLEVGPELGGWSSEAKPTLRLKIVDPKDPAPPKDEPSRPGFDDWGYDGEGEYEEQPEKTAEQWAAERRAREEEAARNAWRAREVKVWFNGEPMTVSVSVGTTTTLELQAQNGENRLEVLQPDSGRRVVRTWWVSTSRTRLRIVRVQSPEGWSGNLEILEPNGDLVTPGRRSTSGGQVTWHGEYTHAAPPPGTYTLRWVGGWRGGTPSRITVDALLDAGTDAERRWRFERLILPGAAPVTLGTVDVEP